MAKSKIILAILVTFFSLSVTISATAKAEPKGTDNKYYDNLISHSLDDTVDYLNSVYSDDIMLADSSYELYDNLYFDSATGAVMGCTDDIEGEVVIPPQINGVDVTLVYGLSYQEKITKVIIPNTVTAIGTNTFEGCTSLKSVDIPDSVEIISNGSFRNCTSLESIRIPTKETMIAYEVFYGCTNLKSVIIPDNNSLTSIGKRTFYCCNSLKDIKIPNGIQQIFGEAFYECESLEKIDIPSLMTEICNETFYGCKRLKDVNILSQNIAIIGTSAFCGCESLQYIKMVSENIYIGDYAFQGCTNLTGFNFSDNISYIGTNAFSYTAWYENQANNESIYINNIFYEYKSDYSDSRINIIVKDGTRQICDYAFANLPNLNKVTIPSSVHNIGYYAFQDCYAPVVVCAGQDSYACIYAKQHGISYTINSIESQTGDYIADCTIYESENQFKNEILNTSSYMNDDGSYTVVIGSIPDAYEDNSGDRYIEVCELSQDNKITKHFLIECELDYYGGFTKDENGNIYVIFGQITSNVDTSMRIVKYDKNWKRIKAMNVSSDTPIYGIAVPFNSVERCEIVARNGRVVVFSDIIMTNGHQRSYAFSTSTDLEGFGQEIGWCGHSNDQQLYYDDKNFYFAERGDAYPRAFTIAKESSVINSTQQYRWTSFRFDGAEGANYTGSQLGGIINVNNTPFVVGTYENNGESRNLLLQKLTYDMKEDGEIKYLTDYDNVANVLNPIPVKINNNIWAIVYEVYKDVSVERGREFGELVGESYIGTNIIYLDKYGNVIDTDEIIRCNATEKYYGQIEYISLPKNHKIYYNPITNRLQWFTTEGNGFRTESIKLHLPKTKTIVTKTDNAYKFDIKCISPIYDGNIIVALYDANENIIATSIIKSNGGETYQVDITANNGEMAKIFTWESMDNMIPLGAVELLQSIK